MPVQSVGVSVCCTKYNICIFKAFTETITVTTPTTTTTHDRQSMIAQAHFQMSQKLEYILV